MPLGYHPLDVEKEWGKLHVAILEREKLLRAEFERRVPRGGTGRGDGARRGGFWSRCGLAAPLHAAELRLGWAGPGRGVPAAPPSRGWNRRVHESLPALGKPAHRQPRAQHRCWALPCTGWAPPGAGWAAPGGLRRGRGARVRRGWRHRREWGWSSAAGGQGWVGAGSQPGGGRCCAGWGWARSLREGIRACRGGIWAVLAQSPGCVCRDLSRAETGSGRACARSEQCADGSCATHRQDPCPAGTGFGPCGSDLSRA